ncbi:MAG: dockerin type I domain-containing protein [Methylococcaceae bacterium]
MLQQFVEKHGIDLAVNPPLPSTIKAILVQTAEDMIHEKAYPRDAVNPDTGTPVLYYEGPDFATGYGLVNAKKAVDLIENSANKTLIRESKLDVDQNEIYSVYITSSIAELKITLAWDDVEASTSLGDERISRLVNDLDLVLIDPNGSRHFPWTLTSQFDPDADWNPPLPVADCSGSGPKCGDLDPIESSDVIPAFKGEDHQNNVEQVVIKNPAIGTWQVVVKGFDIQNVESDLQSYSLVATEPMVQSKILSNSSWKSYDSLQPGWESLGFDDSDWRNAYAPYPFLSSYPPERWIPNTDAVYMWDWPDAGDPTGKNGPIETWYRKTFNIPVDITYIKNAIATVAADDDFDFYVNGTLAYADWNGVVWGAPYIIDIKPYLIEGENIFAMYAKDSYGIWGWALVDAAIEISFQQGLKGDLNKDGCVDRTDLLLLLREIRSPAPYDLSFDLNEDGVINIADARKLVTLFSQPRGVACQ